MIPSTQAGIPPDQLLDLTAVRLQKVTEISQLRSLTAQLEREVSDLEEERRKLKWELKFRAKYHGQ